LNVLGGQLLNNVPRMEGPQSDRDVESYREQAGKVADPTIPAKDKKAALEQIRALSLKYQSLNQSPVQSIPDSPGGSALPQINSPGLNLPGSQPTFSPDQLQQSFIAQKTSQPLSPEQAAQLPSGTPFIGLDGKKRVKH
jgi:hypothetical protein